MSAAPFAIDDVDPQGDEAMALLREAAVEARALYPELTAAGAPWPTNPPTPPRGAYLVARRDGAAVACGALRPMDDGDTAELRRMFVTAAARRQGAARAMLAALEARACTLGYRRLRLETGCRQAPALALYTACGYARIAPFGPYVDDPTSVCFEKALEAPASIRHVGVGVGVLVVRDGRVLLGRRRGAHGAGTWSAPGGRLEPGEGFEACARRELWEETGLALRHALPGPATNDCFPEIAAQYVTVFVVAPDATGEPRRCEPDKCDGWDWYGWDALPQPLFAPLASLQAMGWRPPGA